MTREDRFEPERIVAALNDAGVLYVIVGGLALGAHGVVRATRDLDLVPDPDAANLVRLAATLSRLGAEHPVRDELTGENLALPASMKLLTQGGEVHVLNRIVGTPPFSELSADALLIEIDDGVYAPVCALAHLRAMKRASDRPRDQVDLNELEELHGPE